MIRELEPREPHLENSSMGEECSSQEECSAKRAPSAGSGVEGRGQGGKKTQAELQFEV